MIESVNNEKIKYYAKLNIKKYRDKENLYLVSTPHLVCEALKKEIVKEIFLLDGKENIYGNVTYVSNNVMKKLSSLDTIPDVVAVVKKEKKEKIKGNVLLLDGVQDPGNLGTILRSAVAFNIETVILGKGCVDLYNEKTLRAAEGMHFYLNVFSEDLYKIIFDLKKANYSIIGTKLTDGMELGDFTPSGNHAIIMGNEGNGVNKDLLDLCDDYIYIKMNNKCESLNVGVATSIILYEFSKKIDNVYVSRQNYL